MTRIVAISAAMQEVTRIAERVAATGANLLITGESGAGKDALARFIHDRSDRAPESLVKIDCASLPGDLVEAELFGYERGAFTGAVESKPGRLEAAHKGTLLLDEIAHLSVDTQAKLLRVIEQREFERLGGRRTIRVDTRVMALTNVDLDDAVRRRAFRSDLYYRLNVVHIRVPPLRERAEDIPELARELMGAYAAKHGRQVAELSRDALEILKAYDFPGNVRELANILERGVVMSDVARLEPGHLPDAVRRAVRAGGERGGRRQTLAEVETGYILETLAATRGNKSEAARLLGISRKNLYEKLARQEREQGTGDRGQGR